MEEIFLEIQEVKLINITDSKCWSLKEVLTEAYSGKADLRGYILLTDSILHLIMYSNQKPTETKEVISMIAWAISLYGAWSLLD